MAQAGTSLHFNVDQKKLPPALRIAAVQAIVVLAICASFAIVLGGFLSDFRRNAESIIDVWGGAGDGPDRCTQGNNERSGP